MRELRLAARRLSEAGRESFTVRELCAELATRDRPWARATVVGLLKDEERRKGGRLERVRPGLYRLRAAGRVAGRAARAQAAAGHVLEAVQRLAAVGQTPVTRAQVESVLAVHGILYSSRAVRDGLLRLRQQFPPALELLEGNLYQLVADPDSSQVTAGT